jgi:multiple sugar transport system permease protein
MTTAATRRREFVAGRRDTRAVRKATGRVFVYCLVIAVAALYLFPWLWLFSTSLKTPLQITEIPPTWFPSPVMWRNYLDAVTAIKFFLYLRNTLIISVVVVVGRLFSCSIVAYSLSRIDWPLRTALFTLVLSTMMIPYQVTMIPLYIVFAEFGWVNSFLPLTVPAFFGDAFFIFLLRQFFLTIPRDLTDAAQLDGCSLLGIYWRIIMPLARPALATLVAYSFIGAYNDFQGPLIYLIDNRVWTLALGLRGFANQLGDVTTFLGAMMAAATLYTLPMILLFFLAQRTLIQGIATTGLK